MNKVTSIRATYSRPAEQVAGSDSDSHVESEARKHALIAAARDGDKDAVEQLLVIFQPDARRIAYTECASSADAEDAVQESLLLMYRRIGTLRAVASFSTWMYSIIRNECRKFLRRMRGQGQPAELNTVILAYHSTPDLHSDLAAAIQSLPDKYREAILLRDFQEYTISEIAEQTRISRAAAKSRIHRGREMIREYLIDYGE